ncbi:MAG TPA: energy-coupling factor transporter ATPase [Clostridiales bacterium]|nr:energy-coupling factor transporter ATPase [Clostridiales bacterium]
MAIEINNLSHIYNKETVMEKTAVHDITLTIQDGEKVGIIGHTGSGKSTLVQHLNGLLKPHSGSVTVNGIDTKSKEIKELRKIVGMVFQYPEHQLFEETVYKDIAFGLKKQYEFTQEEMDVRIRAAALAMSISDELMEKSPFELSGGQKRRVAIAGVLVTDPRILVLDEPTAGLDPRGRDELFQSLEEINRTKNTTIIIVSHSMEEVAGFANRILVMNKGTVAMDTTPDKAFEDVDLLESMGLSAPQVTYMARAISGVIKDFPTRIHTVEAMVKELMKVVKHP